MNVRPLFIAHPQSPELIQPSESPFDHPSPQSAAVLGVALVELVHDAPECLKAAASDPKLIRLSTDVSADLKGSHCGRFGCEPEMSAMRAGDTGALTAS